MVIIPFYGMLNQCPGAPDSRTHINILEELKSMLIYLERSFTYLTL